MVDLRALRYFVAVAEERHFGRAAARLHMTQPPLSRAIKQLETELGCELLHRSPTGVAVTAAGASLLDDARTLLAQADRARTRALVASGVDTITVGTLADSAEQVGTRMVQAYRERHPGIHVHIRESDLADPTAGLRAGVVDVALTRAPFDDTGITTRVLRTDPVGVVLRADDPLAHRDVVPLDALADRRWFQFPEGTDLLWQAFWTSPGGQQREGPVVRTAHECMQAVLWNGSVGLVPLPHSLPEGLTAVPLADMPPSPLVVAWSSTKPSPLVRSFARIAAATYG